MDTAGIRPERRNLTVLFADIVGSSALAARLDPEDLRDVLHFFHRTCSDIIRRYEGHIAQYLGDGVLAYFGFPVASEDDAERATNAALGLIESVSATSLPHGSPLQLRVGIATGVVVVGDLVDEGVDRRFAIVGEAPNLAAWLQQHAKPNQIVVAPRTRRLLGQAFEFDDLGTHTPKGHEHPIRLWSILHQSRVHSRFDARRGAQVTEFVGRESELADLQERFDKARQGEAQLIAISGEAGIGKSRLIAECCRQWSGENFCKVLLQCSSYHTSSPWYPVIRYLEHAANIGRETAPSLKLSKLESWIDECGCNRLAMVPALAALLAIPASSDYPQLALTPQQQKRRILETIAGLVQARAAIQTVVVICEDVHWMDPTSWEVLELLRQETAHAAVLMILSCRPEFRPKLAGGSTMTISRLESAHVTSIVQAIGGHDLPGAVVERIVAKTDGVPLFVEEMTKVVLEDREAGGDAGASDTPWTPHIPDTLHDSLMARLDQLGSSKVIAQISASIGREFPLDLVGAVASHRPEEVRKAIDQLLHAELIFSCGDGAGEIYAFKHALVQDAAYASMLRDERRSLHLRIAGALRNTCLDLAERAPELVAHHYTRACEARPAIEYWLKAGLKASARTAFAEAITHFQIALDLLGGLCESRDRDELELQLQQSLASAFIAVKGFGSEETTTAFQRAVQLCDRLEGTTQIFAVLNGMAGVHLMRGEFELSRAAAEDLLARARRADDTTALVMGHRVLGMSLFMMGDLAAAQRELEQAIAIYDPARHAPLALVFSHDFKATAQAYLSLAYVLLGDIDGGLFHGQEALAYAESLQHPHSLCYVLTFFTAACLAAGMPLRASPLAQRVVALSAEYGFPQWLCAGQLLRAWVRIDTGDGSTALEEICESIRGIEATGAIVWIQFGHYQRSRVLSEIGKQKDALALVNRILAQIEPTAGRWYEPEIHRLRAELLSHNGASPADVAACYETAITVAERQGARLLQLRAMNALALLPTRDQASALLPRLAAICGNFADADTNPDLELGRALLNGNAPNTARG